MNDFFTPYSDVLKYREDQARDPATGRWVDEGKGRGRFDPSGRLKLTWVKYQDPIFGEAFQMRGLPKGASASAHKRGPHNYFAHAFINGSYMSHNGKTMRSAIDRLGKEFDRRSLGLFGVDDIVIGVRGG